MTEKPKLPDELLLECAVNNFNKGEQIGRDKMIKEFLELLDSRTIECTMQYGEWWIKLSQLKEELTKLSSEKKDDFEETKWDKEEMEK
jgi:hypothetical protein